MSKKRVAEKTELIKGKCLYLDDLGRGIVKHTINIPVENVLPGELVLVEATKRGKHYHTKVKSVIEKSKNRITPKCPYFYDCGGCQLQHMSYESQLKYKQNYVSRLFKNYLEVSPIIGMENPYNYRNKIQSTFAQDGKRIYSGFYKSYSHDVVDVSECMVQDPIADPILETIRDLVKKHKIRIYNEDREDGFLRHVFIRTGFVSKEVMVVLVVSNKIFPSKNNFVKELIQKHPEIKTVVQNINDRRTSQVLGEQEIVLFGKGNIKDKLCGLDFIISPKSFYQINPVQTEKLYNKAIELADIQGHEVIIDAYSGIGTISLIAAQKAKEVYGIELNKSSIRNAINNAKINNIKNTRFIEGDAGELMVEMSKEDYPVDIVFMDPPREGSDEAFLKSVLKLKPKKIIYISCNPTTQERDIKLLKKAYKIEKVVPVDMFPHTAHVETVMKLKRLK